MTVDTADRLTISSDVRSLSSLFEESEDLVYEIHVRKQHAATAVAGYAKIV